MAPQCESTLGFPQTQLAAMLPILMLALGVDFVIHSLTRWRRLTLEHPIYPHYPQEASFEGAIGAVRTLFPALGVATVTTVVAFGTATLSKIPDLYEWGILGPLGIIQAYLIMGVFVPMLRSYFPPPEAPGDACVATFCTVPLRRIFEKASPVTVAGIPTLTLLI